MVEWAGLVTMGWWQHSGNCNIGACYFNRDNIHNSVNDVGI